MFVTTAGPANANCASASLNQTFCLLKFHLKKLKEDLDISLLECVTLVVLTE